MCVYLDEIKAQGIDEVYCLSVNDAFVMRQWGIHQGMEKEDHDASNPLNPGNFKQVKLIPDGAALFTRGMGMSCVWESERGFGERSWRYSAVIDDMKIEKLFVEVSFLSIPVFLIVQLTTPYFMHVGRRCGAKLQSRSIRSLRCRHHVALLEVPQEVNLPISFSQCSILYLYI